MRKCLSLLIKLVGGFKKDQKHADVKFEWSQRKLLIKECISVLLAK